MGFCYRTKTSTVTTRARDYDFDSAKKMLAECSTVEKGIGYLRWIHEMDVPLISILDYEGSGITEGTREGAQFAGCSRAHAAKQLVRIRRSGTI
ncbi:hypothetical protein Ocin01_12188 [Orchesella cincta]|uniref:Uncharacterized protein n=1 Tax=Orchesella cincta TaxID=48709 RepID=A0A1D2MNS5_ORCCI|nr:hypothetical protein Ocin01_12188 [Orchesella cincta]